MLVLKAQSVNQTHSHYALSGFHFMTWQHCSSRTLEPATLRLRVVRSYWPLCGLTRSALDNRSLKDEFESRRGYIWRVFHLWLRFITFGGRSAHLPYLVHKSGRKTSIIIIIITYALTNCAVTAWRCDGL